MKENKKPKRCNHRIVSSRSTLSPIIPIPGAKEMYAICSACNEKLLITDKAQPMKNTNTYIEELMKRFDKEFFTIENITSVPIQLSKNASDEIKSFITEELTSALEEQKERNKEEMRKLVSTLHEEFVFTGLATKEQWNESIAPRLRDLGLVIDGFEKGTLTARLYKYPSINSLSDNNTIK